MSITDQLGAPTKDAVVRGKFTLNRFVVSEASVAAPVTPTNLSYIQQITLDNASFDEQLIFHQGGGDEKTTDRVNYQWTGNIVCLKGKAPDVLAQLKNITWDTSHAAIPLRTDNDYPAIHLESVVRKSDNSSHLFTLVLQDVKIDDPGFDNPLDTSDFTIPFRTQHMPMFIKQDSELVYDEFSADGTTTSFTLSSTPLTLADSSDYEDLVLDNVIFVKVKASGDSTGTRQTSGVSYSAGAITFTTAPASGSTVQVLYAKATS